MFSSARLRVRGPNPPMVSITISMLLTMNASTPGVPKWSRNNPINRLLNTVDKRLNEYQKPTARARMLVGNSSLWYE